MAFFAIIIRLAFKGRVRFKLANEVTFAESPKMTV